MAIAGRMNNYHKSVLLHELLDGLRVKPGGRYIDATLGGGGMSLEILARGGNVLALDVDIDAIRYIEKKIKDQSSKIKDDKEFLIIRGNFRDIDKYAKKYGFEEADGIIFDLGLSSHHIDSGYRGFSFQQDGPLDMRMDNELNVKASDLVNVLSKGDLNELFYKSGEERYSYAIAEGIVSTRKVKRIETTRDLSGIIDKCVRTRGASQDVKARIFQALRIVVNSELENLEAGLLKAFDLLVRTGRIGVISFHSLEDGMVKKQYAEWEKKGIGRVLNKKPILPSDQEINENVRSRSAKLRFVEKI